MPPDESPPPHSKALEKIARGDSSPRFLKVAKWMRQQLPGDSELGDALSTAGDEPSLVIARRLSELGAQRPSVTREIGLGALQLFQALSESQGRGRGERDLAILFTDLVDFSTWALDVGDDTALELLRRVGDCQDAAVTASGGTVVKHLGDGMMAVFHDPTSAVTAAHAALGDVDQVEVEGYRPRLRAGVHFGRPRKVGSDYLGVDVNVAARVAHAAHAGELLVSGEVCEQLDEEAFDVRRRRRLKAKGAPKELEVFSVAPR
jgi:adenylate cyclase